MLTVHKVDGEYKRVPDGTQRYSAGGYLCKRVSTFAGTSEKSRRVQFEKAAGNGSRFPNGT